MPTELIRYQLDEPQLYPDEYKLLAVTFVA
jgi:hypothetical protein